MEFLAFMKMKLERRTDCQKCKSRNTKNEDQSFIRLTIAKETSISIKNALNNYFHGNEKKKFCFECNRKTNHEEKVVFAEGECYIM